MFARELIKRALPPGFVLYLKRRRESGQWREVIGPPSTLMIELTNACQFRCETCPRVHSLGRDLKVGMMDFDLFRDLVDGAMDHLSAVTLTGLGEPFLYPRLAEAATHLRRRKESLYLYVASNASSPTMMRDFDQVAGAVDHLQISIDGMGDTFERVRVNGHWPTFLENVRQAVTRARGRRMGLSFNMVVLKENYRQMVETVDLAAELGIPAIHFSTLNLVATDHDVSYYRFYFSPEYRREVRRSIFRAMARGIDVVHHHVGLRNEARDCSNFWGNFFITHDGFLVPCCAKPLPGVTEFGNVFQRGLQACVDSPGARAFRREALAGATPSFCRRCHRIYRELQPA
jgi:MoaA/NifB/PqqE/SkfB family radical SAM enzyme